MKVYLSSDGASTHEGSPIPPAPRVALVIPVYCERSSLPPLLERLFAKRYSFPLEVIVVDDSSSDGTGDAVRALQRDHPALVLLQRSRASGRGAAVLDAFQQLLSGAVGESPTIVAEMDGDGSHDPTYLAPMIEAMKDADAVIGSRYVQGGGAELSLRRRWLSRLANGFARLVLRLPYSDCSSGYRCYRPEALAGIRLQTITSGGHATHFEILSRLHDSGARIVEVPMRYRARTGGESKVSFREIRRVIRDLIRIRRDKKRLVR